MRTPRLLGTGRSFYHVMSRVVDRRMVFEREQEARKRFGEKRSTGARPMRGADWGELRVLRDLQ